MRTVIAALPVVCCLGLAACLNHAIPADRAIEATLPATAPVAAASLAPALRVVTFNVHGQPGAVIAKALREDRALRDADVIILEEVHRIDAGQSDATRCSAACALGKELGYYAVFAPGHVQDDGTDGVAIVARAPIRDARVIELPFYDVHVNRGRRIALAATVMAGDRPVTVYTVHLENRITVAQRRAQMAPVLADAARRTTPVIIAGDFNTSPFTWLAHVVPVLTTTQPRRLEELMRTHGFDTPVAESGATSRFIAMRLDHIFTRGFTTSAFAVSPAHEISDHMALWAQVALKP